MKSLPDLEPIPLRGGPVLRWGILAPGVIAEKFVGSLRRHTDQEVIAVGSRSLERAEGFGRRHSIPRAYGSYEALLDDSDVDIVYISSPHSFHSAMAVTSIEAGKHVLVEKPLATSALEAESIRDASKLHSRFAMEAMHTRFHPKTLVLEKLLRDSELGRVWTITADLGSVYPVDKSHRIYDPALGGGALLDIGVYSLWFAMFVMGSVTSVHCIGDLAPTGVDAQSTTLMSNEAGQQAVVSCSIYNFGSGVASVNGSGGRILLSTRYSKPGGFILFDDDDQAVAEYIDRSGLLTAEDGLWQTGALGCTACVGWFDAVASASPVDVHRCIGGAR